MNLGDRSLINSYRQGEILGFNGNTTGAAPNNVVARNKLSGLLRVERLPYQNLPNLPREINSWRERISFVLTVVDVHLSRPGDLNRIADDLGA